MGTWSTSGLDLALALPAGAGRRVALEQALREAITSGRLRAGERLPSTRTLARDLGAARGTVAEAYAQLAAEGWLLARHGSGTVVAEVPATASRPAAELDATRPPRFDLGPGVPDLSAFPRRVWLRALRAELASAPDHLMGYEDPRGLERLRHALAGYLARARGVRADPEAIVVCGGFRQGLSLVCRALARDGGLTVALEDPTVPHHRDVVAATGAKSVDVPVDDHGLVLDALAGLSADVAVVTPAHQFPLGVTLDPGRRAALVGWAGERGRLVLEDDYDGEFRYDRQPIGALQALDPDRVIYAGTASKTLAPGLRLGWLVVPAALIDRVVAEKTLDDGGSSVLDQLALAAMIERHDLDRHVRAARQRYRRRRDRLVETLGRRAPAVHVRGIAAGLHAVLELPPRSRSEDELVEAAARRGLALMSLASCRRAARPAPPALVVGYATPPEHAYDAALGALARLLSE